MLDSRFSHLYFCQNLPTLQRSLSAIADLLVNWLVSAANNRRRKAYVFGVPSGRPLWVARPYDAISLHLVERFQWNLAQIFITCAGTAEKVDKVSGQWVS